MLLWACCTSLVLNSNSGNPNRLFVRGSLLNCVIPTLGHAASCGQNKRHSNIPATLFYHRWFPRAGNIARGSLPEVAARNSRWCALQSRVGGSYWPTAGLCSVSWPRTGKPDNSLPNGVEGKRCNPTVGKVRCTLPKRIVVFFAFRRARSNRTPLGVLLIDARTIRKQFQSVRFSPLLQCVQDWLERHSLLRQFVLDPRRDFGVDNAVHQT